MLRSQDMQLDDPQLEPYYNIPYEVRPLRKETLEVGSSTCVGLYGCVWSQWDACSDAGTHL